MIGTQKHAEVARLAARTFERAPDWVAFYREILGLNGIVRRMYPDREDRAAFEQSEAYQEIQRMLTMLRRRKPLPPSQEDPNCVITIRLPKSLHEALREEAYDHRTSMNKLCISKLLQFVDGEMVPAEVHSNARDRKDANC